MKMSEDMQSEYARLLSNATSDEAKDWIRTELFDRYMGEPYGDEQAGRSKFVDTTVSDAVEAVFTDIMDVFTSQKHLCRFEPTGPEDKETAKQETDVIHHLFWQKNDGFSVLSTWIKEALIQQNAYVWSGWQEKENVTIDEYEDLSIEELVAVLSEMDGEYEILEQSGFSMQDGEAIVDVDDTGQPVPISVKVRCEKVEKAYKICPIPQEEFFCTPRWSQVSLDGIPCHGWKREVSKPELLAMGFHPDSVEEALGGTDEEQEEARHTTKDAHEDHDDDGQMATLIEAYVYMGEDKLRLYRVFSHNEEGEVLKWANGSDACDEVSYGRISCLTPLIVPHRHIGRSIAERVDDIQQVNTVLMRQLLDNLYATNYGRPYFDENTAGEDTYADLLNVAHGAPVRSGGADINWYTPPSVAPTVLPVLEKMSGLKEERTGATRYNQGLDAESLNKTVGGMGMILNASQKKNKLIARTFAETGIKDLFLRMHADLRSGPHKELVVELRGQWVSINPRHWRRRTDMTPAIGMGKGDQDQRRAGHMALGQVQEKLVASGSPMVGPAQLYNNIKDTAETFGIDQIDGYVLDPATIPPKAPPPQQPDPIIMSAQIEQMKIQADMQAKMSKQQQDHEYRMAQLQLDQARLANQVQTDDERLELDRNKARMADDLERDKMARENTPDVPI